MKTISKEIATTVCGIVFVVVACIVVFLSIFSVHGPVDNDLLGRFHTAIADGTLSGVTRMLREHPDLLHSRFSNPFGSGKTLFDLPALSVAVDNNQLEIAKFLLDQGVDPNEYGNNKTALHLAAGKGSVQMAELLLRYRASINARGCREDCTPICVAAASGHLAMVEALVENGADVNQVDSGGCAALYYAACNNHLGIVKFLVSNGAKLGDGQGIYSPRGGAKMRGHRQIVAFFDGLITGNREDRSDTTSTNEVSNDEWKKERGPRGQSCE